jgi:hypothetical protein
MTPQFITLPSGLRVNTAHVILVRKHPDAERVIQLSIVGGDKWMEEVLSLEEWDALLNPPSSPIVESVVNLDNLKPGKACCFTHEAKVRHGVMEGMDVTSYGDLMIRISSDGQRYSVQIPVLP